MNVSVNHSKSSVRNLRTCKGLGEMKSLAQDVGGLKGIEQRKDERNVRRSQLGALLEQMMSPEQYDANVKTKRAEPNL